MNILVCLKQVPDTETRIKIAADGNGIDSGGIKWVMNPYDEIAVEEAIKLKEANSGSKVIAITLGPKSRVVDSLRTALAMGADEGIAIDAPEEVDSLSTAKGLAEAIKQVGDYQVVFTGKSASDDNAAAVSQMLAEYLAIPHTTNVNKIEYADGAVTVDREVEGGSKEILNLTLPAVVAATKGLNTPRYASLPGIMKAKRKPVKDLELSALGVDTGQSFVAFSDFKLPPERPEAKMLSGEADQQCAELVKLLREEAKVI
jgi:electron transfer flavoprotein beta subunit